VDLSSAQWRTSSYSGGNGGQCVQVAAIISHPAGPSHLCAVRDSQDTAGPALVFGSWQWRTFTAALKTGMPGLA
jgi:hypothetical protein